MTLIMSLRVWKAKGVVEKVCHGSHYEMLRFAVALPVEPTSVLIHLTLIVVMVELLLVGGSANSSDGSANSSVGSATISYSSATISWG